MATKTIKSENVKKAASPRPKTKIPAERLSTSYNRYKEYAGQQYTGMKIGRSHSWEYDAGNWKETKITPDLWQISYSVTKRRRGKAPEGSGVPADTEYHWYILAHQTVKKLNANDYSTSMTGLKFKLSHKRAGTGKWNATAKTQKKRMIKLLQEMITQLEIEPIEIEFEYEGSKYTGEAIPVIATCHNAGCEEYEVILNNAYYGIIRQLKSGWKLEGNEDTKFVKLIGNSILAPIN